MVIEAATGLVKLVTEISDDDSSSDEGGSDSSEVEHFDADTPSSRRPAASLSWPCDSGGRALDIWSVGCVALHLQTGCSHLNVVSHTRLTANPAALRTASPKAWFPQGPRPVLPIGLSMEASAFLSECLGEETPTVGELLEHPFLELAKRCHPATSDGDKDVLLKLIGMLDDVLLVGEEEHRHARVAPRCMNGPAHWASGASAAWPCTQMSPRIGHLERRLRGPSTCCWSERKSKKKLSILPKNAASPSGGTCPDLGELRHIHLRHTPCTKRREPESKPLITRLESLALEQDILACQAVKVWLWNKTSWPARHHE